MDEHGRPLLHSYASACSCVLPRRKPQIRTCFGNSCTTNAFRNARQHGDPSPCVSVDLTRGAAGAFALLKDRNGATQFLNPHEARQWHRKPRGFSSTRNQLFRGGLESALANRTDPAPRLTSLHDQPGCERKARSLIRLVFDLEAPLYFSQPQPSAVNRKPSRPSVLREFRFHAQPSKWVTGSVVAVREPVHPPSLCLSGPTVRGL